jgi:shikimate kinase
MDGVGHGQAYGAVTILNATATGVGCALAIRELTKATWRWHPGNLEIRGAPDSKLVAACLEMAQQEFQVPRGASIHIECPFPPSRGLKTSSSVAASILRAAARASDKDLPNPRLVALCIQACRKAGVTLTGALDDQMAAIHGGCHLTNNSADKVLQRLPVPAVHVAIWVPRAGIAKEALRNLNVKSIEGEVRAAAKLAEAGELGQAMTVNGAAYTHLYSQAGLPVSHEPTAVALAAGALGAGLSGTGPAVAALFSHRVPLASVAGGTWHWSEAAP